MFDKLIPETNTETIISKMKTFIGAEIENQLSLAMTAEDTSTVLALKSFYDSGDELNLFSNRFEQLEESELNAIIINPEREAVNNYNGTRCDYGTTINVVFQGDVQATGDTETAVNEYINRVSGMVRQMLVSPHYRTPSYFGVAFARAEVSDRAFFVPISTDSNYYNNVVISITIYHNENTITNDPVTLETTSVVTGEEDAQYKLETEEA